MSVFSPVSFEVDFYLYLCAILLQCVTVPRANFFRLIWMTKENYSLVLSTQTPQKKSWDSLLILPVYWNPICPIACGKIGKIFILNHSLSGTFKWWSRDKYGKDSVSWFCRTIEGRLETRSSLPSALGLSSVWGWRCIFVCQKNKNENCTE